MKKILLVLLVIVPFLAFSQTNRLEYALPFLTFNPNARIGGFGEVDVVSSSFYPSSGLYQNPALLSYGKDYSGIHVSHMPWMKEVTDGGNYSNVNAYHSINTKFRVAYNYSRFDLGEVMFTDQTGLPLGKGKAYDAFHNLIFSYKLNRKLSFGFGAKYIIDAMSSWHPNIDKTHSLAVDLGFQYNNRIGLSELIAINYQLGASVANLGSKVDYSDAYPEQFIPTNLNLGFLASPSFKFNQDLCLNVDLAYQASKLLIPTPGIYENGQLVDGKDSDVSVFKGLYQSFYDAPGGMKEEFQEVLHRYGLETRLTFQDRFYFALRYGKFVEHENKGNRNYSTFGLGFGAYGFFLDYKKMNTDFEYTDGIESFSFGFRSNLSELMKF